MRRAGWRNAAFVVGTALGAGVAASTEWPHLRGPHPLLLSSRPVLAAETASPSSSSSSSREGGDEVVPPPPMLQRRLPSLEADPTHLSGTRQRRAEVQADPRWRAINLPSLDDRRALGARGEHYVWQDSKFEGFELYFNDEAGSAMGFIDFGTRCEGPPGCVHGGALATIFDNVLGSTVVEGLKGQRAVTLNLNVNYRKFTPLGSVKIIETRIDRVEGRKVYVTATLTDGEDGTLHADASALFLVVNWQQIRDQIHNKGNNGNSASRPSSS